MMKGAKSVIGLLFFLLMIAACTVKEKGAGSSVPSTEEATISPLAFNQSFDKREMPFKGQLIKTIHWTDQNGQNTLILSQKEVSDQEEPSLRKAEIFAEQYVQKDDEIRLLWDIHDWVDQCDCDCDVHLVDSSLLVLDIDKDGIAESTFMYLLNDRCDASPVSTKLMMHSGAKKLVIRGLSQQYLMPTADELEGTGIVVDKEMFKKIDPAFEKVDHRIGQFASRYWDQYIQKENAEFETRVGKNN
ncbi:MAG: hypothetical protein AAF990_03990 [Bacteroidota bacterium]